MFNSKLSSFSWDLLVGSALASNSKEHSSGSPPQAAWTTSGATTQGKAKIRRFQNLECIGYDIYHHIIILYIYIRYSIWIDMNGYEWIWMDMISTNSKLLDWVILAPKMLDYVGFTCSFHMYPWSDILRTCGNYMDHGSKNASIKGVSPVRSSAASGSAPAWPTNVPVPFLVR